MKPMLLIFILASLLALDGAAETCPHQVSKISLGDSIEESLKAHPELECLPQSTLVHGYTGTFFDIYSTPDNALRVYTINGKVSSVKGNTLFANGEKALSTGMSVHNQSLDFVAVQPNVLIHRSRCCTIEVQTDDEGRILRIYLYEPEEPEANASSNID